MKVFNLACEHDHRFEGWFGSSDEFDTQLERGLLSCPMCDSHRVRKLPAAPRLNLSSPAADRERAAAEGAERKPQREGAKQQAALADPAQMQALLMKMARYIAENSEDVGERFA
ncbi:MAG TPA: DUF1178 family protein, partial [Burkholderiaceae bacterium]|nr:DUF1178 family protein [Burkholderiaceae bacterium]